MRNSFLDFLSSMQIAMEADDITSQTANDVASTLGSTPSTADTSTGDDDQEDLEKTDDIFGIQENRERQEAENNNEENTEDAPEGDEGSDNEEGGDDEGEASEDPNLEDADEDSDENSEDNDDLLFTKKNRVRDNLAQLYEIVSGDIEIIVNSLTNINSGETIDTMNSVLSHLRNCKDFIYQTLTKDLTSLDYDELLRRYITLKRVYDISIEMMEKYFKDKNKDGKPKSDSEKKDK